MKKIVFTGGGTLGHVMPNLYLMEDLENYEIYYIGSSGIEKERVKGKVKRYYEISSTKLVRGKIFKNLKIPFVLIKAINEAKKILKKVKPDVIFSKGGYVSLPVCVAGRILKIPIVAHESDYSFGLANKVILKLCNRMCVNFKNLEGKNKKITYTGPIFSADFESRETAKNLNLDKNKHTILIIGGSLGSKKINNNIFAIIKDLLANFNVIHITGKGNKKFDSFENYNAFEMVDNIVEFYNVADFVIGRSGAGVTAECFFKRMPMILIPLDNGASRGDQMQNANYYTNLGTATILREKDLTPTALLRTIEKFDLDLDKYIKNYASIKTHNGKEYVLDLIKKY